jgi:hypothetical protein
MASFEQDIKPLFRDKDVAAMRWMFDLHDHQDVTQHADDILETVENGSMPCDAPWAPDQVATLKGWVDAGCPA